MEKVRRHVPLLTILGLGMAMALIFRGTLGAYLVEPAAAMLWAGWRVIASVDQAVYWLLLIVLCALLTIRTFAMGAGVQPSQEPVQAPVPRAAAEQWRSLFENAERSREGEAALRERLTGLLTSILTREGQAPASELSEALERSRVMLPPGVRRYFLQDETGASGSFLPRLGRNVRIALGGRARERDEAIEEVLQWMEDAMGISHDR